MVFVLSIDDKDVLDIDKEEFENNLNKFIKLCFEYNKNSFVITRNYYNTNNLEFNLKNEEVNECINKVILKNSDNYLRKKIILVNHCLLSNNENFYKQCLTNNKLNNYGQLEMLNQFFYYVFPKYLPINDFTSSKKDIENINIMNHKITKGVSFYPKLTKIK